MSMSDTFGLMSVNLNLIGIYLIHVIIIKLSQKVKYFKFMTFTHNTVSVRYREVHLYAFSISFKAQRITTHG
jgi:hypothetical protein